MINIKQIKLPFIMSITGYDHTFRYDRLSHVIFIWKSQIIDFKYGRLIHLKYPIIITPCGRGMTFVKVVSGYVLVPGTGKELRNTAYIKHDMNKSELIDSLDTVKDLLKKGVR